MGTLNDKRNQIVKSIVEMIEKTPSAWERGWFAANLKPINGKTEKAYRGINALYLFLKAQQHGYNDGRWLTFLQAQELGGSVKVGERSSNVLFWSKYDTKTKSDFDEAVLVGLSKKESEQYIFENVRTISNTYNVFNAQQCDRIPEIPHEVMSDEERAKKNADIEAIIAGSAVPITFDGGSRAYYSSKSDSIHLPKLENFVSKSDYYATVLHEIAHSTGHESRLNRDIAGGRASESYALEELRAELACVLMQLENGLEIDGRHFENHAAYLGSWLKAIKEDPNVLFKITSDAMKIADYVSKSRENTKENDADDEMSKNYQAKLSKTKSLIQEERNNEESLQFNAESNFVDQIDAVLSGADTTSTHLKVTNTPRLLQEVGFPNLPILMTARHLKSITQDSGTESMNYHGLSVEAIKRLPELLADPVMIMDSLTRDDSIVVLTENLDKENRPVIASVKIDGHGNVNDIEIEANILTSVYGKDNFDSFIQRNIVANTVLFWNNEKSQMLQTPGIQFPDNLKALDSNIIIRKSKAFVNSTRQNILNAVQGDSQLAVKEAAAVIDGLDEDVKHNEKSQMLSVNPGIQFPDVMSALDSNVIIRKSKAFVNSARQNILNAVQDDSQVAVKEAAAVLDILDEEEEHNEKSQVFEIPSIKIPDDVQERQYTEENILPPSEWVPEEHPIESYYAEPNGVRQQPESRFLERQELRIPLSMKLKEYEKSILLKMPRGEQFSSFVFYAPKFAAKLEGDQIVLNTKAINNFTLKNNGQEVKLTAEELRDVLEGKKISKIAQRVSPGRNAEKLDLLEKNVPEEMKAKPNWCAYWTKPNLIKGKKDKTIMSPITSEWAKSSEPETWSDFATALAFARLNDYEGLTFALDGSGIDCIDLDKCLYSSGKSSELAKRLTNEISASYSEISASGNGIHIFVKDDLLNKSQYKNRAETKDGEIEVYNHGRFICMTGNLLGKSKDLIACPEDTKKWIRSQLGEQPKEQIRPANRSSCSISDNEVIDKIRNSRKADVFDSLYNGGDVSGDKSRDDYALLNILAFFTNCDEVQMERVFRSSGRYREEKGAPYLTRSIKNACNTLASSKWETRPTPALQNKSFGRNK